MDAIRRARQGLSGLGLAMVAAASCGGSPAEPSVTRGSGIVLIDVMVPGEVAPRQVFPLRALARHADGTSRDVTGEVHWTATNLHAPSLPPVLQVAEAGVATAVDSGEVLVSAELDGLKSLATVLIVPPGTFRFSATVRDGPVGVAGAAVAVTDGVGAGLTARTKDDGSFQLFGVSGSIRLTISKPGFQDTISRANVSRHSAPSSGVIIWMRPSEAGRDLSGTYTLTISVQPECLALPERARRRTYTAAVSQTQFELAVLLRGAELIAHNGSGDSFAGQVSSGGDVEFWLGFYWGDYAVAEAFDGGALLFDGRVHARVTDEGIAGTMTGSVALSSTPSYPFDPAGPRCPTDRFTMVRR